MEVVSKEVKSKGEERRGLGDGRLSVMCCSAALVIGLICGRESRPVARMAAPQARKGKKNPEKEKRSDPRTGPRLRPRPKVVSRRE